MPFGYVAAAIVSLSVGQAQMGYPQSLTPAQVQQIVSESESLLQKNYVFQQLQPKLITKLRGSLRSGRYRVSSPEQLAMLVTDDLQAAGNDKHLALHWDPQGYAASEREGASATADAESQRFWEEQARLNNHGLQEMRILPGNVRYLRITSFFWQPDQTGTAYEGAMRFLKGGDAAIIDLRGNSGGDWSAVAYGISHFMPDGEDRLLLSSGSQGDLQQSRALGYLPAGRIKAPLYVLSDGGSVSAAEEFLYHVKAFKLGTIVGATSAGAANNNALYPIAPGFLLSVSVASPRHGLTGTNWEGKGVEPDIAVGPSDALDHAHKAALEGLAAAAKDDITRNSYTWPIDDLNARLAPHLPTADELASYVGRYGTERTVALQNGKLVYSRKGQPDSVLTPMKPGLFRAEGTNGNIRIQFIGDGLRFLRSDGSSVDYQRAPQ